jgi:molecular chaperone GrpE
MEEVNQKENELENKAPELDIQDYNAMAENDDAEEQNNIEAAADNDLKKVQEELADMKDKYLRLYSEFDNFRKRTAREKLELIQSANEKLLTDLLPVIDDFDRAEKSFQNLSKEDLAGVQLIHGKLKKTLEMYGVKVMDIGKGSAFDPDFQEAITHVNTDDENLKGKIVDIVESGYTLHDKVIRFAKVVIGS